MKMTDLKDGAPVEFRRGYVTEYHGDVARFGEVARHFEGGPVWTMPWTASTLRIVTRTADLPKSHRRHSRYGRAGDPACIGVANSDLEGRPDDVEETEKGSLLLMVEEHMLEMRLPGERTADYGSPFRG